MVQRRWPSSWILKFVLCKIKIIVGKVIIKVMLFMDFTNRLMSMTMRTSHDVDYTFYLININNVFLMKNL